jgi:hypothetical protein
MGRNGGAAMEIDNSVPAGNEAVGVDKIRDLPFRNQMLDYDRRCANMEQRLNEVEPSGAHFSDFRIEWQEAPRLARRST